MDSSKFNLKLNNDSKNRIVKGFIFQALLILSVAICLLGLGSLLFEILREGLPWLSWHFLTDFPSRFPEKAGIKSAIFGTIWVITFAALFIIPIGVGAAFYLEEYARKNIFSKILEINISNLAGVPSIVYGLLGLAVFVQFMNLGRSVLAGSLTLALLVLPIIIVISREAIKSVPDSHKNAAYALGASKFQVIQKIVLPQAIPGIMTGTILALSRAIGEAAPMIAISALVYITFLPTTPMDRFSVMPIQIFNWISRPQEGFKGLAAAGIIILLIILLLMNAVAVYTRNRTQKRSEE
jgi:phosphate transport system permease protein|tara:strand:- start:1484 stop:2371 length:888 start_codon:yes stop_codon:yes gene_type:complete